LNKVNLDSQQLETPETTESSTETSSIQITKTLQSEAHHITNSNQSTNRTTSTDQGITCDIVGLDWIELIEQYDGKLEKLIEKLDNLQDMVTVLDQDSLDSSDKLNESSSRLEESEKDRKYLEKQVEEACDKFLEMEGKCVEIEKIYEMSRKELEAVQDVYNGCRDENSRMKQKCSELKKRVKQGKKQRKWQVERLRKIQLDMKKLNFMPKIGGSFGGGGEMSESYSSEHRDDKSTPTNQPIMDWNHIMPLLQSLKTELADLESVVTSTTCTEFGDFEREFESFDPDSMTPFFTQNSQSHTE
jgi:chromosome segregation ATPase